MAMEYVNYIKSKAKIGLSSKSEKPVLTEDDEQFLSQITSQENPPPLPRRPQARDAQIALMDGAQNIPLPSTPDELTEEPASLIEVQKEDADKSRKSWNWLRKDSRDYRNETADGLRDIAQNLKTDQDERPETPEDAEARKEREDMTIILERMNLAAVNNRVFSISDDTQELLQKFNQVLKDLIRGVPTAYDDLERLLTNSDRQLQKTFGSLPPFLQKLIEKLPETMTKGVAPEMMAAASARAAQSGINLGKAGRMAGTASKLMATPSLKELLGKPRAITAMLRSIFNFLRVRFPAFAGMNVLWSLALFVLLFVFWYCHKRGKEVRLQKERDLTEAEVKELEKEWNTLHGQEEYINRPSVTTTTTARPGAPMTEVQEGIVEAATLKAMMAEGIVQHEGQAQTRLA